MHHKIAADDSSAITAHKGDTIEVQLDETPTTGYAWEIDSLDNNILELQSSDYKLYEEAGIGGGGRRTMLFLVKNTGTGNVRLKNAQRWSGDVYKKVEIKVNVN